jgi:hypothetical protein
MSETHELGRLCVHDSVDEKSRCEYIDPISNLLADRSHWKQLLTQFPTLSMVAFCFDVDLIVLRGRPTAIESE